MEYGYLAGVNYESAADGTGVRTAIFLSGCIHNCPECHNPETHDPNYGVKITEEIIQEIAYQIHIRPYLSGITLTGGDPLYNPRNTLRFLTSLKKYLGYLPNIWMYTGYRFEEITDEDALILVNLCDVVVDGRFIKALADKRLAFRGSSNQKIIKIKPEMTRIGVS